jgi:hypothetical protein
MKLRLLMAGVTAVGSLVAAHPSAAPTITTTPVASTTSPAPNTAPPAPAVPAATTASAAADCDAGAWHTDGISVQGRPDNLQPTATYVWHDATGWHLRTSGANDKAHLFTGRVVLRGGTFTAVQKVRDERDDRLYVVGDTVYYRFVTYGAVDGFDFRVSGCTPAEAETLAFHDRYDGSLDAGKIVVGDQGRHPEADPFYVVRSL